MTTPAPIAVTLTPAELLVAAQIACQRQVQNLFKNRRDAYGATEDEGWSMHVEGAAGEMAVAKHFGIYWSGAVGRLRAGDVGPLQVRTRSRLNWNLIVHLDDADDAVFVAVAGRSPRFWLKGWIRGRDAKQPAFWSDPSGKDRPAFFVPDSHLLPMLCLPQPIVEPTP